MTLVTLRSWEFIQSCSLPFLTLAGPSTGEGQPQSPNITWEKQTEEKTGLLAEHGLFPESSQRLTVGPKPLTVVMWPCSEPQAGTENVRE